MSLCSKHQQSDKDCHDCRVSLPDPTAEKKMTEKPGWAYCSTLSSGSRCVCNPGVHEKNLLKLLDGNHQEYSDRLKKAEEGLERKHDLCDEAHIENIKKIEELQADIASRDKEIEGLRKAEANLFVAKSMIAMTEKAITDLRTRNERLEGALREVIKELRGMANVFENNGMNPTATACLFEAQVAEDALSDGKGTV